MTDKSKPSYEELEKKIVLLEEKLKSSEKVNANESDIIEKYHNSILNAISEGMNQPIAIVDEDLTVIYLNSTAADLTGLKREDAVGKTIPDLLPKKLIRNFIEDIKQVIQTNKSFTFKYNISYKGEKLTFEIKVVPLEDQINGKRILLGIGNDITERELYLHELRKTDMQFRAAFNAAVDGMAISTMDGLFIQANNAMFDILGYSETELYSLKFQEITHPDDLGKDLELTAKLHAGDIPYFHLEKRYKRKDGEYIWALLSVTILKEEDGEPTHIIGQIKDITEEKKATEALKHSEERLRELLSRLPAVIYELDSKGIGTFVNQKAFDLTGYTYEDFERGFNGVNLFVPEDRPRVYQNMLKILQGIDIPENVYTLLRKDGSTFPAMSSSTGIIKDGKIIGIRGMLIDISERIKAEQALRESEAGLAEAQNIAKIGNWSYNYKTKIIKFSDQLYRLLGYSPNGIVPEIQFLFNHIFESDKEIVRDAFIKALETRNEVKTVFRYLPKNESSRIASLIIRVKTDEFNSINLLGGTFQDITEQKQKEMELRIAKEKAEEADRLKSAFLANMSHEIRTPMNGILGFANLLKKRDISTEKRERYINIINTSGRQLLQVINDIIDISKIEANELKIKYAPFSLNDLLNELFTFFQNDLQRNERYEVELIVTKGLLDNESKIYTDEIRFRQVLFNLVGNAIKFTSVGSIEFGYSMKNQNTLSFYVKDTGIGISPDKHKIIFERFRQSDDSDTREYGGTGLGLSISKGLINLMGGNIRLESDLGKGSTFFFTLPYQKVDIEDVAEKFVQDGIVVPDLKNKVILIIQEEMQGFIHLEEILVPSKVLLIHAQTIEKAQVYCKKMRDINLILADIDIDNAGNHEIIRIIKELKPNIPIIAQIDTTNPEYIVKCHKAGYTDYIVKPIKKNSLFAAIARNIL